MTFKSYRLRGVEPRAESRLWLSYDDGFEGELDMAPYIAKGGMFAPLADPSYFATVALAHRGSAFGWNLDAEGEEIDFCADAARIKLETQLVERLAAEYRSSKVAAE